MKKPTKSVATTGTFSSAKMPLAATPSIAKSKAKGKAAAAKKSRPSEDSYEEQKMDIDEENDDSNVVLLKEVKPRRKLVKRVTGDAKERDINDKTSSILKTTKGDARARVENKKVDEGKSKIKAVKSNEEQQPEEEKRKTETKTASPKKRSSTKKTKITPVESSSDSDEAPVGKLKKLEVRVTKTRTLIS